MSSERKKYIEKLFDFAKSRVMELVVNGKPEWSWSKAQILSVRKLNDLELALEGDQTSKIVRRCEDGLPNAFYFPVLHRIYLCPAVYRLPDTAILSVLGHEVAHVLGPCSSQFGLYRIHMENLPKVRQGLLKKNLSKLEFKTEREFERAVLGTIFELYGPKRNLTGLHLGLNASDATIKYFEEQGVISQKVQGVPFDQYVFKDVYQCLKSPAGGGFKGIDEDYIRRLASDLIEVRKQYRNENYSPEEDFKTITQTMKKYPECGRKEKMGQMEEVMADWVSAQVVGEFMSGLSLHSPLERLGPIAMFGNLVCMQRSEAELDSQNPASVFRAIDRDEPMITASHPASKERIDKILLQNPLVRKAFGCPATRLPACKHN